MQRKNELLFRVYLVLLVFVGFAGLILFRVVNISFIEGDEWREEGGKYMKWMPVEAERGNIYAEDGALLATSVQFFEIRMDPAAPNTKNFNKNIDSLCYYLARYSDQKRSPVQWKDLLVSKRNGWLKRKESGSRNVLICEKANYNLYRKFKFLPLFKLGPYRGGLIVNRFSKREKPFKELAGRTIGLDRENAVKIGIEGYYDDFLKGETVQKLMRRIPPGLWVPIYDPSEWGSKRGDEVVTNLDIEVQDIVHDELLRALIDQNAKAGSAVVMEVNTGAIKAMSNLSRVSDGVYKETYNHALGKLSEPGSTFKLATVMALLEDSLCTVDSKVDLMGGRKKFYNLWMEDSERHGLREVTMAEAFKRSSNVGIASLAFKYYGGREKSQNYVYRLKSFGLADKTGIDLIGEGVPYIKDPLKDRKEWYGTTVPWMAHGYELMLTPLQVLNIYNAVANGGKLMKPYLVKEILKEGNVIKTFKPEVKIDQIASDHTIQIVQQLLEGVVKEGTAHKLQTSKYDFAGKTGTTSTNYAEKDGKRKQYNASFVGYFPAKDPKFSIIVVLYEPHKSYYGSSVAGPVFKAISDRIFSIKSGMYAPINREMALEDGISLPNSSIGFGGDFKEVFEFVGLDYQSDTQARWVSMKPQLDRIKIEKIKFRKLIVPDVRGMGIRDALYVLENLGLVVDFNGVGRVERQSILPGTKIQGQRIDLYLN